MPLAKKAPTPAKKAAPPAKARRKAPAKPGKKGGDPSAEMPARAPPKDVTVEDSDFGTVAFKLSEGEAVIANAGRMTYMTDGVNLNVEQLKLDGPAMTRIFAGQSLFQNVLTGTGTVVMAAPYPGRVTVLELKPGDEFLLNRSSFVCCDPGVEVSGALVPIGLVGFGQEEGFVVPKVALREGVRSARVWLAAYGYHTKHVLGRGQTLRVDNGAWLASDSRWSLGLASEKKTGRWAGFRRAFNSALSGEGFVMTFPSDREEDQAKESITVYTQSHSLESMAEALVGTGRFCTRPCGG
jgi:uncharacterized protein (AIM24 family)